MKSKLYDGGGFKYFFAKRRGKGYTQILGFIIVFNNKAFRVKIYEPSNVFMFKDEKDNTFFTALGHEEIIILNAIGSVMLKTFTR